MMTMNSRSGGAIITWILVFIVIICAGAAIYLWKQGWSPAAIPGISDSGPCKLLANATTTLYSRPHASSSVFGQIFRNEEVLVGGKTAEGWLGFDPAVAQAPNVGPFRLRYIEPGSDVTLSGNCSLVPTVVSLPPSACFVMAQSDVSIYQSPTSSAPVILSMRFGDYVEAVGDRGRDSPNLRSYFIKVDARSGSLSTTTEGWISGNEANFNGLCDLPEV